MTAAIEVRIRSDGAETRRHFDVVFEKMTATVRVFAEQPATVAVSHQQLRADHDSLAARVETVELRQDAAERRRRRRR